MENETKKTEIELFNEGIYLPVKSNRIYYKDKDATKEVTILKVVRDLTTGMYEYTLLHRGKSFNVQTNEPINFYEGSDTDMVIDNRNYNYCGRYDNVSFRDGMLYAWIFDGDYKSVLLTPISWSATVKDKGYYKIDIDYKEKYDELFYSSEECRCANKRKVQYENGTDKYIGGEFIDARPTPEQQLLVEQFRELRAKMKEQNVHMFFDTDTEEFQFFNGNVAKVFYDGNCSDGYRVVEGWYDDKTTRVDGVDTYGSHDGDGLYLGIKEDK